MTDKTAGFAVGAETKSVRQYLVSNIRDYGMLLSLILIIVFFQVKTGYVMLAPQNVTNVFLQNSYTIVMALGMLLVIVAGYIDLSVGSVCGFTGAVAAVLMVDYHWDPFAASLVALASGALIGGIQGWFVAYLRIPAFIVTLAGMMVFRGLTMALLNGRSVGPFPDLFKQISIGYIPDYFGRPGFYPTSLVIGIVLAFLLVAFGIRGRLARQKHGVEDEPTPIFVGRNALLAGATIYVSYLLANNKGFPNVLILMSVLMLFYAFVTTKTVIGRRIYALGGNEKAAKLSGIKTEQLTLLAFVNMGVLAALAGLIFAARLTTAVPNAGLGLELDVIAACFIGGASASGGVGKVTGAVIGALLMGVMNIGMSILSIGIDYTMVIKGLVLLFAVCLDVYYKKRR